VSRTLLAARILSAIGFLLVLLKIPQLLGLAFFLVICAGGAIAMHLSLHPGSRKLEPALLAIGLLFIALVALNASAYSVTTTSFGN
jgi:hypothetical protein